MADQITGVGLDQSQIADAINRQKISDRRIRNEMMRQGTSDPNSFAMQNQKQLQQAQQPSEFWGAGRKELLPGTDASLVGALGGSTAKLGGQDFYYSPYDLSKASWATQDTDDVDLGNGKYSIIQNGQNLGTGYKSLADTIKEMQMPKYSPYAKEKWNVTSLPNDAWMGVTDQEGLNSRVINPQWMSANKFRVGTPSQVYDPTIMGEGSSYREVPTYERLDQGFTSTGSDWYKSLDEAKAAQLANASNRITGNITKDWETLGQILTQGDITGKYGGKNALGGNNVDDLISGLNTLYGSKPLLYNGKLFGYTQQGDVKPIQTKWNDQWSESGGNWYKKKTTNYWDQGASGIGRQYVDPSWLKANTNISQDGTFTISPEKAAQNPGWLNKDYYFQNQGEQTTSKILEGLNTNLEKIAKYTDPVFYKSMKGGTEDSLWNDLTNEGLFSAVFNKADPVLDKLDPLHNPTQDAIVGLTKSDSQKEAFNKVAPWVLAALTWGLGSGASAGAAAAGEGAGAGAAAGSTAAAGAGSAAAGAAASGTSLNMLGQILQGVQAAQSLSTGDIGGAVMSGLGATNFSPVSSLASKFSDMGLSPATSRVISNFAVNALGNAARGGDAKSALASALFSTAGGEAGNYLSDATRNTLGDVGSKILGGAASGGLSSLYSKNSPVEGSLFGAMSGGLHGFLNSTSRDTNTLTPETNRSNQRTGANVSRLAKALYNTRKK